MNYLDELNSVQRKAVTHVDGPLMVIAGPGSGKTRVLTYKIAHMVTEGIPPWEILALTFTNKSAKEMKERIVKVVGERANRIWAGTFHSIFARILRSEAEKIGYPSDFSIYDTQDSRSAIREIVKAQGLDAKAYNPASIHAQISLAKNNLISPAAYATDGERLLEDKRKKMPYLYKVYELYVRKLQRSGAMDFDDLLYQIHRLFSENPDNVLEKYRKRFKYLLVDEFQDTNQLQYSIIHKLVHYPGSDQNLCVVGDDAQSIYAFRGATIQNILDFEKDFPRLTVYKLEQNYRSTPYIVKAANDIIAHNKRQLKKTIFTDKQQGEKIKVIRAMTDQEEARQVVDKIVEQGHRFKYTHDDFAILYRTNAQSRVFEEALNSKRIPYKIYGGTSFYSRKEIKDVIAYLRVVANTKDEEALLRIINYPVRGIGKTTLDILTKAVEQENLSLWEIIRKVHQYPVSKRAVRSVQDFVSLIEMFQNRLATENAYELAQRMVRMIGIITDLKKDKTQEGQSRIENVTELLDGIKSFVENDEIDDLQTNIEDRSLSSYLQNVTLMTDQDTDEEEISRVKLMSVHAAKGLEFRSVFVVGLEENLFPSMMSLKSSDPASAIAEERRLFYVAVTRAEEILTLTYSSSRYRYGNMQYNNSSRFIEEISSGYLDMDGLGGARNRIQATRVGKKISRAPLRKSAARPVAKNFKASPVSQIVSGAKILHERFGMGKVISIDGTTANKVATILFDNGVGEKRILLRFAKIQVLN